MTIAHDWSSERQKLRPRGALKVRDLNVAIKATNVEVRLVDGISLDIQEGEILGIIGESGSGKSVSALAMMRLLAPEVSISGKVELNGRNVLELSEKEMRQVRGGQLGMIFQEPISALNPVFTIGTQIVSAIRTHRKVSRGQAVGEAEELLRQVGIPDAKRRLGYYPHQLSGGMCQRVMIAMALASGARFILADEPTTALDVTIQAEIVDLIQGLVSESGIGVLFISHDIGLVSRFCHRISVFYAGEIVETGITDSLVNTPYHPYLQGLLNCVTDLEHVGTVRGGIPGNPPIPGSWANGCRFMPRCAHATVGCEKRQELRPVNGGRQVRCWRAEALQQVTEGAPA